jgi:hypothetical protein
LLERLNVGTTERFQSGTIGERRAWRTRGQDSML